MKSNTAAFASVAPAFAVTGFVLFSPVVYALWFSLHEIRYGSVGAFDGGANFLRLLQDYTLPGTLLRTVIHTGFSVLITVAIALAISVGIDRMKPRAALVAKMVVILPWITSAVVATLLFRWVFINDIGVASYAVSSLVGAEFQPMTNSTGAMTLLIFVSVWKRLGYAVIVLLAGLKSIPSECVEAAQVDGATPWQVFRLITLPLLKTPMLLVVVVLTLANINTVETPLVLTGGGPNDATRILALDVYERAFAIFDLGSATALALVMFAANIVMVLAYVRLTGWRV